MPRLNVIDWIAVVLVIIGALNLGILGLFGFDVLTAIFGGVPILLSIVYVIIGLAGLWMIYLAYKLARRPVTPMTR